MSKDSRESPSDFSPQDRENLQKNLRLLINRYIRRIKILVGILATGILIWLLVAFVGYLWDATIGVGLESGDNGGYFLFFIVIMLLFLIWTAFD